MLHLEATLRHLPDTIIIIFSSELRLLVQRFID